MNHDSTRQMPNEHISTFLASIVESSDDAIIGKTLDGIIVSWNKGAQKLYGYSPEEAEGRHISMLAPIDIKDEIPKILEMLRRGEQIKRYETTRVDKQGRVLNVSLTISPIRDGSGRIVGASTIARDITARKRTEQELKIHAHVIKNLIEGVSICDEDGTLIYTNPAEDAMYGYGAGELIGRRIAPQDILPPFAGVETFREGIEQLHRLGSWMGELNNKKKDGTGFVTAARISTLEVSARTYIVRVQHDITNRKRSEEERSRLLAREQAARAEAETANRLKDEFLATVSHELRTPLNAILGWAGMLRVGKLDPETTTHALEIVERNAKAQAQLIEDILDISRIISGKLRLDVYPASLEKIVKAAVDTVRPAAEGKGIALEVRFGPAPTAVSGDPDRLQQVVWNILSNAIKFTPEEGRIVVEVSRSATHAEVVVRDNGQGIEPEFLPYVFERFLQEDRTLTRRHGGLGLGLAIVRNLVEMHGGTVKADSPGQGLGSTFTVRLPLRTTRTLEMPRGTEQVVGEAVSASEAERKRRLKGLKVLVVDDEADTREMLRALLTQEGAEVSTADSVQSALVAIQSLDLDAMVSDIAMPLEDGYALIRTVREREAGTGKHLPAVALTARARSKDRELALGSGYEMFVPKPVEADEIINALAALATGHA
ncbi:MAG TPA: PAS domain S-box protein [Blastocatellia bacterium]|nr:PAS domain S-box protein [Blastocatellia bacterium]